MDSLRQLKISDLQSMCDERESESLRLEFKVCDELKVGKEFHDRQGDLRTRQRDDVLADLTKDVTAFLNAAGGTIIYGIRESRSCARSLDRQAAFRSGSKLDDIRPEKVIDWLRAHVSPPPEVSVYQVFVDPGDPSPPWYLVVHIPQGLVAHMAKDYRFYKRVGNTSRPMEQYEVVDVMNRMRAAALDLRVRMNQGSPSESERWTDIGLSLSVTSRNFIASEYGAVKVTAASPVQFGAPHMGGLVSEGCLDRSTGLVLEGYNDVPHAQSVMIRWGADKGNVVFPGDWFDFYGRSLSIAVPAASMIPDPTYLLRTELFTTNSGSRGRLHVIRRRASTDEFEVVDVAESDHDAVFAAFWKTYHKAREKLRQ